MGTTVRVLLITILLVAVAATPVALAATEPVDLTITEIEDIAPNETTTGTVTAVGASRGISAYELTLALEGEAATFEDIAIHAGDGNGPLTDIEYAADGTEAVIAVALLDATHEPAAEIDLFDVTLEGATDGTAGLEITRVMELTDLDIDQYEIRATDRTTVQVGDDDGEPLAVPGDVPATADALELDLEVLATTATNVDLAVTATNTGDESISREIALTLGDDPVDDSVDDDTAEEPVAEDDSEPYTDNSVPGFEIAMTVIALLVATVTLGRDRH
ncbi:PGF-CTERM sorting domain-containing protein [Halobacteria archaeon AArc-m2/3/4]|uniref:PGF-CTERM sorting domain-containing protein n=1 Tax=Natronoglomus mannanivorans TaxID=2979990 RepID=A0ABT2QJC7_9EURY|nr:PGF-CTERM sorting domain-containing protein [Halobacteria archaeon AArc-m2/3/4]